MPPSWFSRRRARTSFVPMLLPRILRRPVPVFLAPTTTSSNTMYATKLNNPRRDPDTKAPRHNLCNPGNHKQDWSRTPPKILWLTGFMLASPRPCDVDLERPDIGFLPLNLPRNINCCFLYSFPISFLLWGDHHL